MTTRRGNHGAVVLGDSNIYVTGGWQRTDTCECMPSSFLLPASSIVKGSDDEISVSLIYVPTASSARKRRRTAQEDHLVDDGKSEKQFKETVSVALTGLALSSLRSSITGVQQQQTNIRNERHKWLITKADKPGLTAICDEQLAQIEETEGRLTKKEESLEEQLATFIKEQQEQ